MRLSVTAARTHGLISGSQARELRGADQRERLRQRDRRARASNSPQAHLQRLLTTHWPSRVAAEYTGAVPGRRFRLDLAFPEARLAVECDGWEHHGRYLADFKRDRERDRALLRAGWRVCRFYASEIHADPATIIAVLTDLVGPPDWT